MPVARQVYTVTATWTAAQFATAMQSAFTDAGLMTGWFDSFLNGTVENRILEVNYSPGATYGKTYYWFMFSGGTINIHVATGWNTTTKVPTGTGILDFGASATNTVANHQTLATFTAASELTITRYTSGAVSFFLIRTGTTSIVLHIPAGSVSLPSWIDFSKNIFHLPLLVTAGANNNWGQVSFTPAQPLLRRSFVGANGLWGSSMGSGDSRVAGQSLGRSVYTSYGHVNGSAQNYGVANLVGSTLLPVHRAGADGNPAYAADNIPVFSGLPYSPYINSVLPSDFGITFHFANNTLALQDTFTVTAGVEVWEVLAFANGAGTTGQATPLFLARTT